MRASCSLGSASEQDARTTKLKISASELKISASEQDARTAKLKISASELKISASEQDARTTKLKIWDAPFNYNFL